MADSSIPSSPSASVSEMAVDENSNLTEQISNLNKQSWVNLQGLIDCATSYLSTPESSLSCISISLLGLGSFNTVYRLAFSDGTQLAASISNREEVNFDARLKQSEIETMKYVRDSGLYPDIPVPKLHAWDITFENPVGAPYILRDVVEGESLAELRDEETELCGLDTLSHPQQLSIVKTLAKLKASLSRPVPFEQIGSITLNEATGSQSVGPFMNLSHESLGGPFTSIDELWRSCLEPGMLHALKEWRSIQTDDLPEPYPGIKPTPQMFAETYRILAALIPHFKLPEGCDHLALHHPNLALRNIFFDKESLSSDEPKITGLIDWESVQILPLMLTAQFPTDLMSDASYPFARSDHQELSWRSVPFDWVSIGDPATWPEPSDELDKKVDYKPILTAMVRRFYLRAYFGSCYGEQLCLLMGGGKTDLAQATLFKDAPYYLKFHEVVSGGWSMWLKHAGWIRETYWRLRELAREGKTGEKLLIMGPNAYRSSVKPSVYDLGALEGFASDNGGRSTEDKKSL